MGRVGAGWDGWCVVRVGVSWDGKVVLVDLSVCELKKKREQDFFSKMKERDILLLVISRSSIKPK